MQSNPTRPSKAWPTTRVTLLQSIADQHDNRSWDCFEQTYGPLIHRYCVRRGLQEADAYDVVQDVLIQVSRGIGGFQYHTDRGRFRGWLGTITHRAMLKHKAKWRKAMARPGAVKDIELSSLQAVEHVMDEGWIEAFNSHVFAEAVKRLQLSFSDEVWRAFNATFIENRTANAVAEELRRPVGWVYQAKSQVIRQLKAEILYLAQDSVLHNLQPGG